MKEEEFVSRVPSLHEQEGEKQAQEEKRRSTETTKERLQEMTEAVLPEIK